jgi:glucokinase
MARGAGHAVGDRPPTSNPRALGLDLGGTEVKACVLDSGPPLTVSGKRTRETEAITGAEAVLDRIADLARETLAAEGPVDRVGLGAPGPLDVERGRSLFMPNLPGWTEVPIVAELEDRLGLRVFLINDVRALTLAEHHLGAGRGCDNLICFALGTGVGGGVVVGGHLLLGMNGTVGELGHQTVEPDGLPCHCGSRGCLEQYASGTAIAAAAGLATAKEAVEAARAGDAHALDVLERAGTMLGIGIANAALAVGPERVIVGGGVAAAGELVLGPARKELVTRNRMMPVERIEVVQAALGGAGGSIGAALFALDS